MYDVMAGVRVVEVAEHTFVPSAGVVLADWGADVIKVERATGGGDASRHLAILQRPGQRRNPFFEVANRGKRSIGLDLTRREGRELLYRLVADADVFLTNLRGDARKKLGIEPADLMAHQPRLIYARGTGYGTRGPMAEDGGFDFPTAWCLAGAGYAQTPADGGRPPNQPGSVGDLTGGATLAGAIAAALFRRERTGRGAVVDHALFLMGSYIMTQSLAGASLSGAPPDSGKARPAAGPGHPLVRLYRTADDRWLSLCFLQDRWFADLARRLDREDLLADIRFADEAAKMANAAALIAELDAEFARHDLDHWRARLAGMEGVWAPLQSPAEVLADGQALVNGFVTEVGAPGDSYLASATPGQFDERPVGELRPSPGYGEHTTEVLRELGVADDDLQGLLAQGVLVQAEDSSTGEDS